MCGGYQISIAYCLFSLFLILYKTFIYIKFYQCLVILGLHSPYPTSPTYPKLCYPTSPTPTLDRTPPPDPHPTLTPPPSIFFLNSHINFTSPFTSTLTPNSMPPTPYPPPPQPNPPPPLKIFFFFEFSQKL